MWSAGLVLGAGVAWVNGKGARMLSMSIVDSQALAGFDNVEAPCCMVLV